MGTTPQPTVVALFDEVREAQDAVVELERSGFGHDQVGFLFRDRDLPQGGMTVGETGTRAEERELEGAAAGIGIGGLLGAAAALLVPGLGIATVGGALAAALLGAAAGGATGGIIGLLSGMGVPEPVARYYDPHVQQGRSIVAVRGGDRAADAAAILARHGGYDVDAQGGRMTVGQRGHPSP